jgi:hypothetical protein
MAEGEGRVEEPGQGDKTAKLAPIATNLWLEAGDLRAQGNNHLQPVTRATPYRLGICRRPSEGDRGPVYLES